MVIKSLNQAHLPATLSTWLIQIANEFVYEKKDSAVEVSQAKKFTMNAIPEGKFLDRPDASYIRKTFSTQHYVGDVTSRKEQDLKACLESMAGDKEKGFQIKFRLVFLEWMDLTSEEMMIMLAALNGNGYLATNAVVVVGRHICYISMLLSLNILSKKLFCSKSSNILSKKLFCSKSSNILSKNVFAQKV